MLLESGAKVEQRPSTANRRCWLRRGDDGEYGSVLKQFGANIDRSDYEGRTAILIASRYSNERLIETLIELGADANLPTMDGRLPLVCAAWGGRNAVVHSLIRGGADVNKREHGERRVTALFAACNSRSVPVVATLLRGGADPYAVLRPSECGDPFDDSAIGRSMCSLFTHQFLFDAACCLYALRLHTYILLWICNWLPCVDAERELTKIRLIESVTALWPASTG